MLLPSKPKVTAGPFGETGLSILSYLILIVQRDRLKRTNNAHLSIRLSIPMNSLPKAPSILAYLSL